MKRLKIFTSTNDCHCPIDKGINFHLFKYFFSFKVAKCCDLIAKNYFVDSMQHKIVIAVFALSIREQAINLLKL